MFSSQDPLRSGYIPYFNVKIPKGHFAFDYGIHLSYLLIHCHVLFLCCNRPEFGLGGLGCGLMNWAQDEFWYTEVGDWGQSVRQCSTLAEFRQASQGWKQVPGLKGKTGKQSSCAKGALK